MPTDQQDRAVLREIARRAMLERGLLPDFSAAALAELDTLRSLAAGAGRSTGAEPTAGEAAAGEAATGKAATSRAAAGDPPADLRELLWSSIDNDDSLDLDQLTVVEALQGDRVKILVAIADVDSLVGKASAIDEHAGHNTTSVYTAAEIFPMLPEAISTGLTSLNQGEDRLSVVVEMVANTDGSLLDSAVYRARVRSKAKLAYNSVAAWLDGIAPEPEAITAVEGLAENLRLQDKVAQGLKAFRQAHGALTLETVHALPVFAGETISDLRSEGKNRAKDIITGFMLAANGVTARWLSARQSPSIRRVVRTPERWDRIVQLAAERGSTLPAGPDPRALEEFLTAAKAADPLHFPDLSLAVVKLLGAGEYTAEAPGDPAPGHFGLAVKDYGHSTAPNRRYTDLVTQRLLKAALEGQAPPYSREELDVIAARCTEKENAANKVERQVNKSAAALFLRSRIGEEFDAVVTGAGPKGTWVRLLSPPVDGKLAEGLAGVDVGDRVRVRLISVDIERGFIDFAGVDRLRD
jgi:ribonuclease R